MADITKETAYSRLLSFENAMCRRLGKSRMERYARNLEYYQGENLPPDNIEQPLGINYAKGVNEKHTHYLFGQWDEGKDIIGWRADALDDSDRAKKTALDITKWCYKLAKKNDANVLFFEAGLNGSIFGDSVLRATFDQMTQSVVWENIMPEYVHFRWHPSNLSVITEAIISYPISRADAQALYGTTGSPVYRSQNIDIAIMGFAMYWEYWTSEVFEQWIDDIMVKRVQNPTIRVKRDGTVLPGIIPLIPIPNTRAGGEFYGYADAEPMFLVQDELNRKMADQGDVINNFAHPITVINKWYGDVEELPVGPDQVWDLGSEGKATILQWEGTPPAVMAYVESLMGILFDLSSMTPIAFARHKGTQQSAIALAIEMMPVTERAKWKRSTWASALRKLLTISAYLEDVNAVSKDFTYEEFLEHDVNLIWAPMLPRDRMALVQENISLVVNHLRSLEQGLIAIGEEDPLSERDKILKDIKELVALGAKIQGPNFSGTSGGSGSSSAPEGVSNSELKGRPRGSVKS